MESQPIRLRAALAVIQEGRILLVPHFHIETGVVQWLLPGGALRFDEHLAQAALREFEEESGLQVEIISVLDVSEVILPEKGYHSITVSYLGRLTGGNLRAEPGHRFGVKTPRWFNAEELDKLDLHPRQAIEKALGLMKE